MRGLRSGDFTIGFAHAADVGEGIVAEPIWRDPIVIAVPARHSLLAHKQVPLNELQGHPLVLCDKPPRRLLPRTKSAATGSGTQTQRCRRSVVAGHDANRSSAQAMGLVSMTATKIPISQRPDVVIRPLAQDTAVITTSSASARKQQFIGFAGSLHRTSARTSG
ncbi:LysR substrate-binding domain-containing protein [Pseudomonas aeruginosa]